MKTSTGVPKLEELPELLTMKEVASLLRCGANFPYALAHEGRLKTIRLGKKLLAPKAAVARLIAGE